MPQYPDDCRDRKLKIRGWVIKKWNDFKYKGNTYELTHLSAFRQKFIQPAKSGKPARAYQFEIEFSLHCFTHGPHHGRTLSDYDPELYYRDSRETRVFCFRRHELSFLLPDIAKTISERKCYHTQKGNYFLIELAGEEGMKVEYEVYFKVSRASKGGLRLFIESAYVRDDSWKSSQPKKKKIGFFVIAHNTQAGKAIKVPK
ncbi:hypothetical protein ACJJIU_22280 (plasmid) [Microbulbifer sp. CnH-101-E]|uniref:hypothetical protein n=1 Tax=unclassified Microbulbifer TaxID=2619833 RepID=UPI0040397796